MKDKQNIYDIIILGSGMSSSMIGSILSKANIAFEDPC